MARSKSAAKPVTKTQAVKDYLKKRPGAMPKAISDALAKVGIEVNPRVVNTIKSKIKRGRRRGARGRRGRGGPVGMQELLAVKRLTKQLGGTDRVKQALETLRRLQ